MSTKTGHDGRTPLTGRRRAVPLTLEQLAVRVTVWGDGYLTGRALSTFLEDLAATPADVLEQVPAGLAGDLAACQDTAREMGL